MNAETWFTADEALELGLIDEIAENETKVEPLTDKEIKNILNKYGNSAPKQFLNKFEMNKEENEQKQAIENGGFWDSLKALFKANPEKLKELEIENISDEEVKPEEEIDNQEDGEGMDEALAAEIDAAKSLLMANGFIVLTEDEAEEMNNELTAETGKAIEFKDNFDTLSEDYNDIMAKLKEFEKEFSTKSGKVELSNDTPKKQETTREILLKKYAQKTNITNSKFFKNLSK
jgi:hypothetical protein